MWHDAEETRVNGGRALARCKWNIFFVAFFSLFSSFNSAFGAQSEHSSHIITVQAVVPVQPGFVRMVANHSWVTLEKNGLYQGENGTIMIVLRSVGQETLRFHRLSIDRVATSGETARLGTARTDREGKAIFSFAVEASWSGHQRIQVTDVTYDKNPIVLNNQPLLHVLEPLANPPRELEDWEQQEKLSQNQTIPLSHDLPSTLSDAPIGPASQEKKKNIYFAEMRAGP
jgi:hypothetical protein